MSLVYKVYDASGTAYTVPVANVSQIIEGNPYDQMMGVRQSIQLVNGTVLGVTTSLRTVTSNAQMIAGEVGAASATGMVP